MKLIRNEMTPQIREDIKERKKLVWDSLFYSHQRMDLLIITISGAGLYAVSEVCKYLLQHKILLNCCLKISAGLFVLSIITNFLSQYYSSKSHHSDYCSIILQLAEKRTPEEDIALVKYNDESTHHNKITQFLNKASMWIMFLGLVTLSVTLFSIF